MPKIKREARISSSYLIFLDSRKQRFFVTSCYWTTDKSYYRGNSLAFWAYNCLMLTRSCLTNKWQNRTKQLSGTEAEESELSTGLNFMKRCIPPWRVFPVHNNPLFCDLWWCTVGFHRADSPSYWNSCTKKQIWQTLSLSYFAFCREIYNQNNCQNG